MSQRLRVGVMMPASDGTTEPDFQTVLGTKGITVHSQRLWDATDVGPKERFERMNGEIETAARYLGRLRVDAIAYSCTTGSFFRGPGWDQEMEQLMEKASGAPCIATSPSVVEALRFFGAKKLSVITPYAEWNNRHLRTYLEAMGFDVLHVDGHPKTSSGPEAIREHEPGEIVQFGIEKCRPEADALLCSCTGWRALEVVEELEKRVGKPVVTASQATIWVVLRRLGITDPVLGYGALLRELAPVPSL